MNDKLNALITELEDYSLGDGAGAFVASFVQRLSVIVRDAQRAPAAQVTLGCSECADVRQKLEEAAGMLEHALRSRNLYLERATAADERAAKLADVLDLLERQGGLGQANHERIRKVLGR